MIDIAVQWCTWLALISMPVVFGITYFSLTRSPIWFQIIVSLLFTTSAYVGFTVGAFAIIMAGGLQPSGTIDPWMQLSQGLFCGVVVGLLIASPGIFMLSHRKGSKPKS